MTIGLAISGPEAGLAAFRALCAVEKISRGAIGGFVSFVAISDGALRAAETQRGGAQALFGGADPPPAIAEAPLAGLMSSGPDRPEPLIQFTPADPGVGIVCGHRLPNNPVPEGIGPPNLYALQLMRDGRMPRAAIAETFRVAPTADAGMIAMNLRGDIALGNTDLVAGRDDIGEGYMHDAATGLTIGILHNSMFPVSSLAGVAISAALDAVAPADSFDETAPVGGLPIVAGPQRALHLDAAGLPLHLSYPNVASLGPRWDGSAVMRGDPVIQGGQVVGRVIWEPYCITRDLVVTGGRGSAEVRWRRTCESVRA